MPASIVARFTRGFSGPAVPKGSIGEDAMRTALEHDEGLSCRRDGVEDVDAVLHRGVTAGDADRVLGRGHVEGGDIRGSENCREVGLAVEGRG